MKAVILAAGKGERLEPLTQNKPKSMLPIANKPLISYIIEKLEKIGIDEIGIVVGYKKNIITEYFKDKFKYFEQKEQIGTANALYAAKNFLEDEFLLIYGDIIFENSLEDFVRAKYPSICVKKVDDVSRFGKVYVKDGKLEKISEKNEFGEGFVNAGIYLLTPDIFEFIENVKLSERSEYELTDVLMLMNEKRDIFVHELYGYWNDIGYPWNYLDANIFMLNKIGFSIGENCEIENAILRKPVIIGKNCKIKDCIIDSSIIGNNCKIGEFSVVKRSVIMSNTNIPHQNYVSDSIVGENCNLGAGTKIANLKFDESNVKVNVKGKKIDTGKRKFGAIIGDYVKTGINVSIYPGIKIGSNVWIDAECLLREDVEANSYVKLKQNKMIKKLKEFNKI